MPSPYDEDKDAKNIRKHGISLARCVEFDIATATVEEDQREDYHEQRWVAIGWIGRRLHVLCYTLRDGQIRPISLRKANPREVRRYGKQT